MLSVCVCLSMTLLTLLIHTLPQRTFYSQLNGPRLQASGSLKGGLIYAGLGKDKKPQGAANAGEHEHVPAAETAGSVAHCTQDSPISRYEKNEDLRH